MLVTGPHFKANDASVAPTGTMTEVGEIAELSDVIWTVRKFGSVPAVASDTEPDTVEPPNAL
jgi:hypothetical protein